MKNLFLFALALSLFSQSCQKDDDHDHVDGPYFVTIDIQRPAPGTIAAIDQALPVKVIFTRADNQLIHNITIQVADMNNQVIAKIWEFHVHEPGSYTFESDNYVPAEAGSFKLQAITTDMEGGSANLKEVGFVVE